MTTDSAIALSGKSSLATSVGAFITGRGGIGANGARAARGTKHLLADLERQIQSWQGAPSCKKR